MPAGGARGQARTVTQSAYRMALRASALAASFLLAGGVTSPAGDSNPVGDAPSSAADSNTLLVWHFTDTHIDPFYTPGALADENCYCPDRPSSHDCRLKSGQQHGRHIWQRQSQLQNTPSAVMNHRRRLMWPFGYSMSLS